MHELNSFNYVGKDFYSKPTDAYSKSLEYVYNKITGRVPTMLAFAERFELDCLEEIDKNFELFTSNIQKVKDSLIEEGIWIGKPGTPYEDGYLKVNVRTEEADHGFNGIGSLPVTPRMLKETANIELYAQIKVACKDREQAKLMANLFDAYKIKNKSSIFMLSSQYGDLNFTAMPVPELTSDLALNYGEDFLAVHENVMESLRFKKSGLYLFNGPPGTGKSSYIKHLLSEKLERKLAYIPVSMTGQLVSPELVPLLMDNKDIILVIEDAEKALISRDTSENAAIVSTILNLTDGFIGDAMNVSIIATFNTDKEKIDAALLRKGRLRVSHEFKLLSIDEARKLAKTLGKDPTQITEPTALADIYNIDDETGYKEPEQRRVGFN